MEWMDTWSPWRGNGMTNFTSQRERERSSLMRKRRGHWLSLSSIPGISLHHHYIITLHHYYIITLHHYYTNTTSSSHINITSSLHIHTASSLHNHITSSLHHYTPYFLHLLVDDVSGRDDISGLILGQHRRQWRVSH